MAVQVAVVVAKAAAGVVENLGKDKATGKFSLSKLIIIILCVALIPILLIACVIAFVVTLPLGALINFIVPEDWNYDVVFPDNVYYEKIGDYPLPCDTDVINSQFGTRDNPFETGITESHTGLDFAATWHSPVTAIADGTVTHTGYKPSYGRCVIVEYEEFTAIYAHLAKSYAVRGAQVSEGMVLGTVGGDPQRDSLAGDSTGAHLHFELRKEGVRIDPYPFLFEKTEQSEELEEEINDTSQSTSTS